MRRPVPIRYNWLGYINTAMIYTFCIFDRHCNCIYHREYPREGDEQGTINKNNQSDAATLLFGVIFSLNNIVSKLGDKGEAKNFLKSFSMSKYRVHLWETATGLKFALISDNLTDNLQNVLQELYKNYFIRNITFNALSPAEFKPQQCINNPAFIADTDKFLSSFGV